MSRRKRIARIYSLGSMPQFLQVCDLIEQAGFKYKVVFKEKAPRSGNEINYVNVECADARMIAGGLEIMREIVVADMHTHEEALSIPPAVTLGLYVFPTPFPEGMKVEEKK